MQDGSLKFHAITGEAIPTTLLNESNRVCSRSVGSAEQQMDQVIARSSFLQPSYSSPQLLAYHSIDDGPA